MQPLAAQQSDQASLETNEAVTGWLRQNAIPLRHVEAGHGFADLEPLKRIWRDVRVVGLGESSHGTREFVQIKHRLLEFLVTEMGFTAFVMEAPFSDVQPINDYVLHGTGDRATVLTGNYYVVWDTEEFSAMLDWMRSYNQTVPDDRKVRFHGFDIMSNAVGRAAVLDYLRRLAPERATETEFLFRVQAIEEARVQTQDSIVRAHLGIRIQEMEDFLTQNRASFVERSSSAEFDRMLHLVRNMKLSMGGWGGRGPAMADNLFHIIEQELPGTRFVLWGFDGWLAATGAVGSRMKEEFGQGYYAVGLTFHQGSYQTRIVVPGEPAGELRAAVAPAAPAGSLSWYFSRANVGNFFLDFRGTASDDSAIQQWLAAPQVRWVNGWGYKEPGLSAPSVPRATFDGMIFIETTTPTRPTSNAIRSVGNRERL